MEKVFIELLNMGLTATWVVLAVLAVRALCRKAPRWLVVVLWALVGVRLVCPFVMESVMSLIPSGAIVSPEILFAEQPKIHTGVALLNSTVNPVLSEHFAPEYSVSSALMPENDANPMQMIAFAAALLWIAGMAVMFAYSIGSYMWLRHKVRVSLCYRDNIYFCDSISTPFVFGVIKPRIYIPSGMGEAQMECVIAHESAHLKRKDHWWKTIAFFLLSVYWFHPLLWISYLLFSKDIERACDERVVRRMEPEERKDYAEALVLCSLQKRRMFACPLAFGEVGVKNRVKSVLNYKRPAIWPVAVMAVAGIAIALCFLTNPVPEKDKLTDVYGASVIGGADSSASILLGAEILGQEVTELPEYMEGSDEEGLYVFVWQLAENSYSSAVKEKRETGYSCGELWSMKSIGLVGAKLVVGSYGYPKEAVTIVPYSMPYSSYSNSERMEDPEGYQKKLETMFWGE